MHQDVIFQLADIDRCSTGVCGDNGVCSNTVGSFNCICNGGYDLNESDICTGLKVFNIARYLIIA